MYVFAVKQWSAAQHAHYKEYNRKAFLLSRIMLIPKITGEHPLDIVKASILIATGSVVDVTDTHTEYCNPCSCAELIILQFSKLIHLILEHNWPELSR